jgi:SAM-dependent methyltransferase
MSAKDTSDLVDETAYPPAPIDMAWSVISETNAVSLIVRYQLAMRRHDQAISTADEMWNGIGKVNPKHDRTHYMYGGRSALKCVVDALIAADIGVPRSILDFPSGHGRATRFLVAAFPEAETWAGDINTHGVDFCASRFGARPFYSRPDLAQVRFPRKFDLVWCGSLASHLPEEQCLALFRLLLGALEPDGILCITTCGRGMQWAHENMFRTIHDEGYEQIRQGLARRGFGFAPYGSPYGTYDTAERYGMAFLYPEWVQKHVFGPEFQLVHLREKGWHGQQDLWCFINRPLSSWYDWSRA